VKQAWSIKNYRYVCNISTGVIVEAEEEVVSAIAAEVRTGDGGGN
jgi:hypothetical protein